MATYLLVHGAWHSGQCWERVVPLLASAGHRAITPSVRLDNPGVDAIPRTHIHCTVGKPDGFARRPVPATQPNGTPAQVRELATGHDCMITMPVELAELLLSLTCTVSEPGLNSDEMSGAYRPVPGPTMDTTA